MSVCGQLRRSRACMILLSQFIKIDKKNTNSLLKQLRVTKIFDELLRVGKN
jgi:hypothetical protein